MKTPFFPAVLAALGLITGTSLAAQPTGATSKGGNAGAPPTNGASAVETPSGESRELFDGRMQLQLLLSRVDEKHPDAVALRARIAMLEKLEPRKISIDFPGGSLSELLKTIGGSEGVSLSIIYADEANAFFVRLPGFSIRNVNLSTLVGIIRNILPKEFILETVGQMDPNSVVGVLRRRDNAPAVAAANDLQMSFQLAPYLTEQSVDDIVGAIRAAWELDPKHDKNAFRLKYHPPTSILLVSGPRDGVDMADRLLRVLKRSNPPSADTPIARPKESPPEKK